MFPSSNKKINRPNNNEMPIIFCMAKCEQNFSCFGRQQCCRCEQILKVHQPTIVHCSCLVQNSRHSLKKIQQRPTCHKEGRIHKYLKPPRWLAMYQPSTCIEFTQYSHQKCLNYLHRDPIHLLPTYLSYVVHTHFAQVLCYLSSAQRHGED